MHFSLNPSASNHISLNQMGRGPKSTPLGRNVSEMWLDPVKGQSNLDSNRKMIVVGKRYEETIDPTHQSPILTT